MAKFRERLLSSTIDARISNPLTGADFDRVARDVVEAPETRDAVTFTDERDAIADAAWKQYADFFGSPALGRSSQTDEVASFQLLGGSGAAHRLRELEAEGVATIRARPRQR
ncbi:hypothetical protein ABY45_16350 [Microbacterium maritypicum]|uniref:hypothetical protein n=1 Tax=Microbacterium maritypicum TaxID=33918 RepID=UPI003D6DD9C6